MLTFVRVLEEAKTIEFRIRRGPAWGMPLIAALLICHVGAVVSAFGSSTAILAAPIPWLAMTGPVSQSSLPPPAEPAKKEFSHEQ